jgi:serine/threonine protein kinase
VADRYEVVRLLARGGMADVYDARDKKSGGRVALKVLREGLSKDPEVVTRFQREVRAVSSLKSGHVVRVFDCGTTTRNRPFMVLEFLSGADLGKELAKRGAIPLAEAAQYLTHACHAMIEAHDAGIIHRDLKPSNLVLAEEGGKRVLKIVDFGISKLRRDTQSEDITNTHALFGSPLYMSPETFRSAKGADERSDIWSLGVIFYEMITGVPPFAAENAIAVGLAVTRQAHTPPSLRKPGLPGATDVVVARALKKDPKERYQTMRELLAALEVFTPRGRNETMAIPRIEDRAAADASADDEPRTMKRDLVTEIGMRSMPSMSDEPATSVRGGDADEHDKPTRSVTLDAFAALSREDLGADVEGPTRIREAGGPASQPSIAGPATPPPVATEPTGGDAREGSSTDEAAAPRPSDTGRVESPMSVTTSPETPTKKGGTKTVRWVAAAALVFGVGGFLIAKSSEDAPAAASPSGEASASPADKPAAAATATATATAAQAAEPPAAQTAQSAAAEETASSSAEAAPSTDPAPADPASAEPSATVAAPPVTGPRKPKPPKPAATFVPKGI